MDTLPDHIPWWKSKIIVGVLVSSLLKLAVFSGLIGELSGPDYKAIADVLALLIGSGGDLVVIGARLLQKKASAIRLSVPKPPAALIMLFLVAPMLMLSACGGDEHPAVTPAPIEAGSNELRRLEVGYSVALAAIAIAEGSGGIAPSNAALARALLGSLYAALTRARTVEAAGDLLGATARAEAARGVLDQVNALLGDR